LQHALYRAAKADPSRRFHALFDKVSRRDGLDRAWEQVRRNQQVLLSPNRMGLISLDGTVVAPRPFRDWRGKTECVGEERR
jgi:hypothetical protein